VLLGIGVPYLRYYLG